MVEFRDVVKKYAGTDEALGVPAGTVGGIPVVTPDDLGPAAAMTPAEVVTDEDAQAALSGAFAALDAGREGTGMPEGVVSAPVGTVYRDLAATNGAVLWVKAAGTGNTGWRVMFGDTGWRAITTWDAAGTISGAALASADWAPRPGVAGGIFLRRSGDTVFVRLWQLVVVNANPNGAIFTWPAGFAPGAPITGGSRVGQGQVVLSGGTASHQALAISTAAFGARVSGATITAGTFVESSQFSFDSAAAWPTTLPGTAA